MALTYPAAEWRPLGAQTEPRMTGHDIVCLHTMVGSLYGTDRMFKQNGYGGTESHFGVGGKWGPDESRGMDGEVYQWQDLNFQADANLEGNPRVISIETADNAPSRVEAIEPWTAHQCESIAQVVAWCCDRFDIPPVLVPDSRPSRRGIAYHRQGCEHSDGVGTHPGYLVSGGERWSSAIGKGCPGPARIAQITSTIIPRVRALLAPPPSTDLLEELMADPQERAALIHDILHSPQPLGPSAKRELGVDSASLFDLAQVAAASAVDTRQAVDRVETDLADGVKVEPAPPAAP